MAEAPKIPSPTDISTLLSAHSSALIDLLNAQVLEATTTFGAPAPPTLPKFTLPPLPTLPAGPAPMSFLQLQRAKSSGETMGTPQYNHVKEIIT